MPLANDGTDALSGCWAPINCCYTAVCSTQESLIQKSRNFYPFQINTHISHPYVRSRIAYLLLLLLLLSNARLRTCMIM